MGDHVLKTRGKSDWEHIAQHVGVYSCVGALSPVQQPTCALWLSEEGCEGTTVTEELTVALDLKCWQSRPWRPVCHVFVHV